MFRRFIFGGHGNAILLATAQVTCVSLALGTLHGAAITAVSQGITNRTEADLRTNFTTAIIAGSFAGSLGALMAYDIPPNLIARVAILEVLAASLYFRRPSNE